MHVWTNIKILDSEESFEAFRDDVMCCSKIQHKDNKMLCNACGGDHVCVERRIHCKSVTCGVDCEVVWKVWNCTASDRWVVFINEASHGRGALPCFGDHPTRITAQIKAFLELEDEALIPPMKIKTRLKNHPAIKEPARGWPTMEQIVNAIKRIREEKGLRNTREAVRAFVMDRVYSRGSEIYPKKAIVFSSKRDGNGYPYIASGTDEDPFMLGVTSPELIDSILPFADGSRFSVFHADATFKLSDISYPVVTCGFTDSARQYQVAALFVVSQRTQREYAMCFDALAELVGELRGRRLNVSAIMGDADNAQLLGLKSVPTFQHSTPLMCFFHVLYNVRKRTNHYQSALRKSVMTGILDMHFTTSIEEFVQVRNEILQAWNQSAELIGFAQYFTQQWLTEPFWRWQIFHSPAGYAATNNPCEVFNAKIKRFTQRHSFHMTRLLQKLCELVECHKAIRPVGDDYTPTPTSDIVTAAKRMVESGRTSLRESAGEGCIRVEYRRRGDDVSSDTSFTDAFDKGIEVSQKVANSKNEGVKADAEKSKAAKLYKQAVSWSLWRAHTVGMPSSGWLVDYVQGLCECRYFAKFKVCAHLLIAQCRFDLRALGKPQKLHNRSRVRKAQQIVIDQQQAPPQDPVIYPLLQIEQPEHTSATFASTSASNTQHFANTSAGQVPRHWDWHRICARGSIPIQQSRPHDNQLAYQQQPQQPHSHHEQLQHSAWNQGQFQEQFRHPVQHILNTPSWPTGGLVPLSYVEARRGRPPLASSALNF